MDKIAITILYTMVDDFFKSIENTAIGKELQEHWQSRRGPQKRLSLSETVTLNMIRFYVRLIDLKSFHRLARNEYGRYFPQLPNYENFLKASNCSMAAVAVFTEYLLQLNRMNSTGDTYFIDATALSVCHNEHISSHKVTKGFAQRGKTTKGWFYGFKLHGVCDGKGKLMSILFTSGNVHDSQVVEQLTAKQHGVFVGDAGYILNNEVLLRLYENHRILIAASRKNMKKLMSKEQLRLLRKRSIIETQWGVLKERFVLVYHLSRSVTGLCRHYLYSIASFIFQSFFPKGRSLKIPA